MVEECDCCSAATFFFTCQLGYISSSGRNVLLCIVHIVTTFTQWYFYHLGICTRSSLFRIISCSECKLAATRWQYSKMQYFNAVLALRVELCRRRYIDIFTYRCKRHVRDSDCACYIQSHKHFFLTDQLEV